VASNSILTDPRLADAVEGFAKSIDALSVLRPPNQPLSGFTLPEPAVISEWQDRLRNVRQESLIDTVTSLTLALPSPELPDTEQHEHLNLYYHVRRFHDCATNVVDVALTLGLPSRYSVVIDPAEIRGELSDINRTLVSLGKDVEYLTGQARRSPLGDITISVGPIGVPLSALQALIMSAKSIVAAEDKVNVSSLALVLAKIAREGALLWRDVSQALPTLPVNLIKTFGRAAKLGAELSKKGADLLQSVIARLSGGEAGVEGVALRAKPVRARASRGMAIDLGAKTTRIYRSGSGVVLEEPTLTVEDAHHGERVHGLEAFGLLKSSPAMYKPNYPLREGRIRDEGEALLFLQSLTSKVYRAPMLGESAALVSVPARVNGVDRRALARVVRSSTKARDIYLVDEPVAAALGADRSGDVLPSKVVISARAGTTDVAVLSGGTMTRFRSIAAGGDAMDDAIVTYAVRHWNLAISTRTAERIKREVGAARRNARSEAIEIVGRDMWQGVPRAVRVRTSEVADAIYYPISLIVEAVKDVIPAIPYDFEVDDFNLEILLTGGVAKLPGLAQEIRDHTGFPVAVPDDPELCVVKGLGRLADSRTLLRRVGILPAA
jgi:rod shape-determining protein MreB